MVKVNGGASAEAPGRWGRRGMTRGAGGGVITFLTQTASFTRKSAGEPQGFAQRMSVQGRESSRALKKCATTLPAEGQHSVVQAGPVLGTGLPLFQC